MAMPQAAVFSIALGADVRIAAEGTKMNCAFIKIGLSGCELGSSYHLSRLVGKSVAAELLYTGRFVDAQRALRIGLVSDVVPADQLVAAGKALARGPADIDRAFTDMTRARAEALTILPSSMFLREHRRLVDLPARTGCRQCYSARESVDAGGLMSYGPNLADLFHRAAGNVDKILKGTKPADLPVEQPTKFELVINLKKAKALGLTIPQSVLLRADEVIR
jgi:enoyl-CoA hydratase/carnithine racemase